MIFALFDEDAHVVGKTNRMASNCHGKDKRWERVRMIGFAQRHMKVYSEFNQGQGGGTYFGTFTML